MACKKEHYYMAQINVTASNDSGFDNTFGFRDGNTLADLGSYFISDGGTMVLSISANENSGQGRLGHRKVNPDPGPWITTDWINNGDVVAVG